MNYTPEITVILGLLSTLGTGAFLYLQSEIKTLKAENQELKGKNELLIDILNSAIVAIIDIADTHASTSEALKIAKTIQAKVKAQYEKE